MRLSEIKTIAVVGISDKPDRSSYGVADYLKQYYQIIPVNPALKEWQGLKAYASVSDIPKDITVDLVDVFRRPEHLKEVVDDVLARGGIKRLWFQQGIRNDVEAKRAEAAGIEVVQDSCLAVVHAQSR